MGAPAAPGRTPAPLPVAHARRLAALPSYRRLRRRRLGLVAVRVAAALLVVGGAAWLVARPTERVADDATSPSRDVVLCLDASGSMDTSDAAVLRAADRLTDARRGDRVAVVLFDGASLTALPLTDDHGAVRQRLEAVGKALDYSDVTMRFAVQGADQRASQAGEGLVACVQRFDALDQDRGRTVVLATDGDPVGPPEFTLADGAAYAAERDVAVHVVVPGDVDPGPLRRLRSVAEETGGSVSDVDDDDAARAAVEAIAAQEGRRLDVPPRARELDAPGRGALACAAGTALLALTLLPLPRRRRRDA